jgi:glutamine synthetase
MSVFIGSELTAVLDELEEKGNIKIDKGDNMYMKLGIDKIPQIILDNTDRNRTSPFAFTGNKFEFRAVGSDQNVAQPMTILNLIMAEQLTEFHKTVKAEMDKGTDKKIAIVNTLRDYIKSSKKVRFEGDGYSDNWEKEAEKRGLPNVKSTPGALEAFVTKKSKDLFSKHGVMSPEELEARNEIYLENYMMKIQIEARLMGDMALNQILPTAVKYQNTLAQNAKNLSTLKLDNSEIIKNIELISGYTKDLGVFVHEMIEKRKELNKIENMEEKAEKYCREIKEAYFDKIRYAADKLEMYVDDELWPLPKYREMLFLR